MKQHILPQCAKTLSSSSLVPVGSSGLLQTKKGIQSVAPRLAFGILEAHGAFKEDQKMATVSFLCFFCGDDLSVEHLSMTNMCVV